MPESIVPPDSNVPQLDPEDWESFRGLARQMMDDVVDHLASVGQRPAWQPLPDDVREALREPVPREAHGAEATYRVFRERVLPYSNGNTHPRFWGWVQGSGLPIAVLADLLASGMNPHLAGLNQAPRFVEEQVVAWIAELMDFPKTSSGLLCSGGSMAGILALAVARHARAGFDVREQGLQGAEHPTLTLYGSRETHSWATKAVELLGLGRRSLRLIDVDDAYRVRVDALRQAIADDRRAGRRPFCVIGTAGTVNTGATDDLEALADLCAEEQLWFHVDGAFGAWARIAPALRPMVRGIERADSLALDLHKWMYLPFESACLLVRDADAHRAAFATSAPYLGAGERGVSAGGFPLADRGVELTRSFKALKIWMALKTHGVEAFADMIEQNVGQARLLVEQIEGHAELQLLAPAPLNVVCFRYVAHGSSEREHHALNQELLLRVQESGFAVPSSTWIGERFALRVAIVNHRTRAADIRQFVERVVGLGRALSAGPKIPNTQD